MASRGRPGRQPHHPHGADPPRHGEASRQSAGLLPGEKSENTPPCLKGPVAVMGTVP